MGVKIRHVVLAFAGIGVLLVAVLVPDVIHGHVVTGVEVLGNDYILVGLVAVVVAVVSAWVLFTGRSGNLRQTELPEPERPARGRSPGATFDAYLATWRIRLPLAGRRYRTVVRERIHRAAVRVVMSEAGCSRSEAESSLHTGRWTDDPIAANFLRNDTDTPGYRQYLRFPRHAKHTIHVIERRAQTGRPQKRSVANERERAPEPRTVPAD